MGYQIEFNWILKLKRAEIDELLSRWAAGDVFEFRKNDERIYPMRIPIDVVDEGWAVRGKGEIIELWIGDCQTRGKIRAVRSFTDQGEQTALPLPLEFVTAP